MPTIPLPAAAVSATGPIRVINSLSQERVAESEGSPQSSRLPVDSPVDPLLNPPTGGEANAPATADEGAASAEPFEVTAFGSPRVIPGRATVIRVVVRNATTVAMHHVELRVRVHAQAQILHTLPAGVRLGACEAALPLGELDGGEAKAVELTIVAEKALPVDLVCEAVEGAAAAIPAIGR